MSGKTLAQIACTAMQEAYRKSWDEHKPCLKNEDWIAAANAVVEECAKVADGFHCDEEHETSDVAAAIRALKGGLK